MAKKIDKIDNTRNIIDHILEYLENERKSIDPWIQRKEIAIWSAVVLYLSGLIIVVNYILKTVEYKTYSLNLFFTISICIYMILFLYFIFLQFNYITNAMTTQAAINFWIIKIIEKGEIPPELSFIIDTHSINPISRIAVYKLLRNEDISKYIDFLPSDKPECKFVRHYFIFLRPLLPVRHLLVKLFKPIYKLLIKIKIIKDISISHMEYEEGIIYDLILIPTIISIIYYYFLFDC